VAGDWVYTTTMTAVGTGTTVRIGVAATDRPGGVHTLCALRVAEAVEEKAV